MKRLVQPKENFKMGLQIILNNIILVQLLQKRNYRILGQIDRKMTACLFGSQTGHERTNHTNFLPSWIQKNFCHTAKESALLNALCIVA